MSLDSVKAKLDEDRQAIVSELNSYIARLTTIRDGVENVVIPHWDYRLAAILDEVEGDYRINDLVEDSTPSIPSL